MNIRTLRQLEALNREIELDQCRLQKYRGRAQSATARFGSKLKTGDEREAYLAEIVDLSHRISRGVKKRMAARAELLRFIDKIDDSCTRTIFKLRYVDGKSWREVARAVHLSESAAKRRHAREITK